MASRRETRKAQNRADLIKAAHDLVREEGYESLTIRKLAERAGYATMSVYSYFPDKHAILLEIAQDAFTELARRMERSAPDDPLESLKALMRAYSEFGLENPNEYQTVFMTVHSAYSPDQAGEMARQNPALGLLRERVEACIAAGHLAGNTHAISTLIWTAGHGAISLMIGFPHYPFGDRTSYVERVIDLVLAGLASRPVAPLDGAEAC